MSFEDKCPSCGAKFVSKDVEKGKITNHYECEHRAIAITVNETITISEKIEAEIKEYPKKDLPSLYADLAKLEEKQSLIRTAKLIDYVDKGKKILETNYEIIFHKICEEYEMCKKIKHFKDLDITTLASLVGTIIVSSIGIVLPIWLPVALLSLIIVKIGISKFCKCI